MEDGSAAQRCPIIYLLKCEKLYKNLPKLNFLNSPNQEKKKERKGFDGRRLWRQIYVRDYKILIQKIEKTFVFIPPICFTWVCISIFVDASCSQIFLQPLRPTLYCFKLNKRIEVQKSHVIHHKKIAKSLLWVHVQENYVRCKLLFFSIVLFFKLFQRLCHGFRMALWVYGWVRNKFWLTIIFDNHHSCTKDRVCAVQGSYRFMC